MKIKEVTKIENLLNKKLAFSRPGTFFSKLAAKFSWLFQSNVRKLSIVHNVKLQVVTDK